MQYAEDNIDVMDKTYAIHEDFLPDVEKKLNRIIRKCEKYGNPFAYEIVGTEMRFVEDEETVALSGTWHKFFLVKVNGVARIANWEFIATLDIRSGGNVIRRYNNDVEIPECYKTSPNVCGHCNTARPRNNLYLIRNVETGEFKQVGGNCLASYTHGLNLEYIVKWIDGITELEKCDGIFYGAGATTYHSVKEVVYLASVIIDKVGYLRKDPYSFNLSTKDMVCTMLGYGVIAFDVDKKVEMLNKKLENHSFDVRFTRADFDYHTEKIQPVIDYYKDLEDRSEFTHNVQVIIKDGLATYKDLGYLCYLPQGYAKHIEREAEKATRQTEKREHWGEIGKRYKDIPVRNVRRVASYETAYGLMYVWQIVTEDGTILTWKTSNYPDEEISTVTFTVKEHGEYKGVPQTVVTRCKFAA